MEKFVTGEGCIEIKINNALNSYITYPVYYRNKLDYIIDLTTDWQIVAFKFFNDIVYPFEQAKEKGLLEFNDEEVLEFRKYLKTKGLPTKVMQWKVILLEYIQWALHNAYCSDIVVQRYLKYF